MSQAQPFNVVPPPAASHRPAGAADSARARQRWERLESFYLQSAHRLVTVAVFAAVGAVACVVKNVGPYGALLATAVVSADLALAAAVLAWWTQRRERRRTRESIGLVVFTLVVMTVSGTLYGLAKTNHLQPVVTWTLSLFPQPNSDAW